MEYGLLQNRMFVEITVWTLIVPALLWWASGHFLHLHLDTRNTIATAAVVIGIWVAAARAE